MDATTRRLHGLAGSRPHRDVDDDIYDDLPTAAPDYGGLVSSALTLAEADIPRRAWLVQGRFMAGTVAVLVGAASAGKSSLLATAATHLALGVPFGGFVPIRPLKIVILNTEDDYSEQHRRTAPALRALGRAIVDLGDNLIFASPEKIATLLTRDADGRIAPTRAMTDLEAFVAEHRPDVLVLDPLAELHDVDENSNGDVRAVLAELRSLAQRYACCIVVVHHTRKGTATFAGDVDMARGASSIIGLARTVLTLATMTVEEARAFGLSEDQRRHFFRLDVGKSNYTAPQAAEWYQRLSVQLENGDYVAAVESWMPPRDVVSLETRCAIIEAIKVGLPDGPYASTKQAGARSVHALFAQHGISTAEGQDKLLLDLQAHDGFTIAIFKTSNGDRRKGLRHHTGLPHAKWVEAEPA